VNEFADETHRASATWVLGLQYHAVAYLHLTGLGDFNNFTRGFMAEVLAFPTTFVG